MLKLSRAARLFSTSVLRCSEEASTTHFGFREVPKADKEGEVRSVFSSVAGKYDVMNDGMSLGLHRAWKDYFVFRIRPQPRHAILDVAGGTGDIAFRCARARGNTESSPKITVCDINEDMLEVGKERAKSEGFSNELSWVAGNGEKLPFPDDSFDIFTIAFGIRNFTDVDQALREAHRVLRKGGRFFCLEFSQVHNPLLSRLYDAYSFEVIPVMGHLVAGDWNSYQYLVESIRKFPDQDGDCEAEFSEKIRSAGFKAVSHEDLTFGVVALHTGTKF